ncbi:helix-turn-helix domain-containing protein [Lacticaseibacillus paracasei]|uniref:helix-turn-helix domain-containing protein n=1 Tax=Lacticaseibacillus paracasei TaxID=1597 RepID=UPI00388DC689
MFGEKLTQLRKQKGLSQNDLAEALGISRQAISKYENDLAEPDLDKIEQLRTILGISYADLLGDEPQQQAPSTRVPSDSITITSLINDHLGSYTGFQVAEGIPSKTAPSFLLIGESRHRGFLGTTRLAELGWYHTRATAETEIKKIQDAMQRGETIYHLAYTAKVNKKGTFGVRLADNTDHETQSN